MPLLIDEGDPSRDVQPGGFSTPAGRGNGLLINDEPVDPSLAINNALGTNPKKNVENQQVAQKVGLPVEAVEAAPEDTAMAAKRLDINGALQGNPVTTEHMADPAFAKVAIDDVPQLTAFEQVWQGYQKAMWAPNKVAAGFASGIASGVQGIGSLYEHTQNLVARGVDAVIDPVLDMAFGQADPEALNAPRKPSLLDFGQAMQSLGKPIDDYAALIRPEASGGIAGDVLEGAGQLAGQIIVGALAGPEVAVSFLAGQGADQMADMAKEAGAVVGASTDLAIIGGAAVTSLLEKFGIDNLMKRIPEALKSRIIRTIAGAGSEGIEEMVEGVAQNLMAAATFDPENDIWDGTLYQGGVAGIVGGIASAVIPGHQKMTTQRNAKTLDEANKAAAASETNEIAPEQAAAFQGAAMRQGGVDSVFVNAQALADATAGDDQEAQLKAITGEKYAEFKEDLLRGGDVELPVEQFAQHILGTDLYPQVKDHLRLNPEDYTVDEIAKNMEEVLPPDAAEGTYNLDKDPEGFREIATAEYPDDPDAAFNAYHQAVLDAGYEPVHSTPDQIKQQAMEQQFREQAGLSHAEVSLGEAELGRQALFQTAQQAGLTQKQFEGYRVAVEAAAQGAREAQVKARLKQEQAKVTEEWTKLAEPVRAGVEESVHQIPVYSALDSIGRDRLDRAALVELLPGGPAQLAELPKANGRQMWAPQGETGINPEAVAQAHGFDTAQEMIGHMLTAPPMEQVIAHRTDKRMTELYGELGTRKKAVEAALENLHTDTQARVLAFELEQLQKNAEMKDAKKQGRIKPAALKKAAAEKMDAMPIKSIKPGKFMAAERFYAKEAGKLLRPGKTVDKSTTPSTSEIRPASYPEAIRAKTLQLYNFMFTQLAYKAQRDVKAQRAYMRKFVRKGKDFPKHDAAQIDQIKALLKDVNLSDDKISLGAWTDLYNNVKSLDSQGRAAKKYAVGGVKIESDAVQEKLVAEAALLPDTGFTEQQRRLNKAEGIERPKRGLASVDAAITKVEFMMSKLGPYWRKALFQPFADAEASKRDLQKAGLTPINKAIRKLPADARKRMGQPVTVNGYTIRGYDIMHMALNVSNKDGLEKTIAGSKNNNGAPPLTEESIQQYLDHLGDPEWDIIERELKAAADSYPRIEAIFREEHGRSPEKIEGRVLKTATGREIQGGYFPLMYAPDRAARPSDASKDTSDIMNSPSIRGAVYSGMTKERTKATDKTRPVLVDFDALLRGLNQNYHYISHYEAVRDVRRMLNQEPVSTAVRNKLGNEYHDAMLDWVEALATNNHEKETLGALSAGVRVIRTNLTAAVLGFSASTGIAQTMGITSSIAVLGKGKDGKFSTVAGGKWMISGFDSYIAGGFEGVKSAMELSGELRHRLTSTDRDMADVLDRASSRGFTGKALSRYRGAQQAGLMAIGGIQLATVDIPTWMGAFNRGQSEGMNEQDSVEYADHVLRTSQSGGSIKDLTALQRNNNPGIRLLTMFSTYTSLLYSMTKETIGDAAARPKNIPSAIARLSWVLVIPAILDMLRTQDWPDSEDEDAMTQISAGIGAYAASAIPVVGPMAGAAMKGYGWGSISPLENIPRDLGLGLKAAGKGLFTDEELTTKEWDHIVKGFGEAAGLPGTLQMKRAIDALAEDDFNMYDLVTGPKN